MPNGFSILRSACFLFPKRDVNVARMTSSTDYVREHLVSSTKKISFFSSEGKINLARKVFDEIIFPDSVSCNVMIREYIRHGRTSHARDLFDGMPDKNSISWNSMIMAYAIDRKPHIALKFFIVMPHRYKDAISFTTIISGLARTSCIADAWKLFKQLPAPDCASWASIISGFQQNGLPYEALSLFKQMLSVGSRPTAHSFTSILAAAADVAALSTGEQIYSQLLKRGFDGIIHVANSALSMFVKSGCLGSARNLFIYMPQPDRFTWNAMLSAYGQHGYGFEAIVIFYQMQKSGIQPDRVSFLSVLQGCSHGGYVKEGLWLFDRMCNDFGIPQEREHYHCMVDILARSGLLKEAAMVTFKMPFKPSALFWRTVLNGCRVVGDFRLGAFAAEQVLELDPYNSATCLMIMEMYATVGRFSEVARLRRWLNEIGGRKDSGYSWIEINGRTHYFTTRDETHHVTSSIYLLLKLLAYVIAADDVG